MDVRLEDYTGDTFFYAGEHFLVLKSIAFEVTAAYHTKRGLARLRDPRIDYAPEGSVTWVTRPASQIDNYLKDIKEVTAITIPFELRVLLYKDIRVVSFIENCNAAYHTHVAFGCYFHDPFRKVS